MKKFFVVVAMAVLTTACANLTGNTRNSQTGDNVYYTSSDGTQSNRDVKYNIIDQEFDDMLAPDSDYETLSAYELQACGDSYLPPAELKKAKKTATASSKKKAKKAASKVTKNKKVVNNVTVHYVDGPAPVPAGTISSSSTTTTTTSNSSSYTGGTGSYTGAANYAGTGSSYSSTGSSYSSTGSSYSSNSGGSYTSY